MQLTKNEKAFTPFFFVHFSNVDKIWDTFNKR